MSRIEEDLRELLRRRAGEVPPHVDVPRSMVRRARRRIAMNALGVTVVIAALGTGAFAGLRAINKTPAPGFVRPGPPSAQATPSGSTTSACASEQLRAVASMEGAAGSRVGAIRLTNVANG